MRVLLTGATGFIGGHLGKLLHSKGHELHVLSRSVEKAEDHLSFPAEVFEWDPQKQKLDPEALSGVSGVIHLAGANIAAKRWREARKKLLRDSRTQSAKLLLDTIAAMHPHERPECFISASASGFYGSRGDQVMTEDSPRGQGFIPELCEDWENAALDDRRESIGMRRVALRCGMVLGADGGALEKMVPFFRKGLGGRLSDGQQWMSWIHIQDLVRLYAFVLENQEIDQERVEGVLNACSPQPITNEVFTRSLGEALGRPTPFPVPAPVLKLALGELATELLASRRVLPKRCQHIGFQYEYPYLPTALKEIFSPSDKKQVDEEKPNEPKRASS